MSVGQTEDSKQNFVLYCIILYCTICCIDNLWKVWEGAVTKETVCFAEVLLIFKA